MEDKVGKMIHSDFLDGLEVVDAITTMCTRLEQMSIGKRRINYKLRDANYSRQRYWGEPFPIIYDADGVAQALPESELPLVLPDVQDFKPGGGKGPLAKLTDWVQTPDGLRDTDTMPGFAGSSWYFLRYMDPHNNTAFASPEAIHYWQDVDFYIGGAEHAVGHLMYSRMWHKFLYDQGLVPTQEPYKKLVNQGMIGGIVEYASLHKPTRNFISAELTGQYPTEDLAEILVHAEFVSDYGDIENAHLNTHGVAKFKDWRPDYAASQFITAPGSDRFMLKSEIGKMSKRLYNVVNPDDMVAEYGADCFRMYEMFLGPIEVSKPWNTKGITGVYGFLRKFWGLFFDNQGRFTLSGEDATKEELRILHTCIKKKTDDIDRFSMNTCISHFMIVTNELRRVNCNKRSVLEPLVVLMAPFAPHITEEIWHLMGHDTSVCDAVYPVANLDYLKTDTINYPVQINGKMRGNIEIAAGATNDEIQAIVLEQAFVHRNLDGAAIKKFIVVPGRIINIVA
jgi:leucyl-tRNA synthetase